MREFLRLYCVYIFLLPVFFVVHALNESPGLIPGNVAARFLIYYLLLAGVMLMIGRWIFKSTEKAGVWAFCLLVIFFFFGAVQDFLKERLPSAYTSYSVLLPLVLILVAVATYMVWRRKKSMKSLTLYLNVVFCLFLAFELVSFSINSPKRNGAGYPLSHAPVTPIDIKGFGNQNLPDIFFIIFDEYASSRSLQNYLSYTNTGLDDTLRKNGFYAASGSRSNYNVTHLSIGSTLNMSYFDTDFEGKTHDPDILMRGCMEVKYSRVPAILSQAGYTIKNFGLFDFAKVKVMTSPYFASFAEKTIYLQTLWGRIRRDIFWKVTVTLNKNAEEENLLKHAERDSRNFNATIKELQVDEGRPRFVYCHLMMPHPPFYFDRNGKPRKNAAYHTPVGQRDSLYIEQVLYANTLVKELMTHARTNNHRPRVVVIQGDHGFRSDTRTTPRERQFMNLNAIYFSDRDYRLLYDSISSVNTFRVIFKKYFNAEMPLLKDSTILIH
ncbi:MAG: sulfatase-like hydrolase/transferase [Chitinophagaceae bacterium]|nr:sulfatase-like hydrolase/transferase [Chitinophagaceae bacterium]